MKELAERGIDLTGFSIGDEVVIDYYDSDNDFSTDGTPEAIAKATTDRIKRATLQGRMGEEVVFMLPTGKQETLSIESLRSVERLVQYDSGTREEVEAIVKNPEGEKRTKFFFF